MPMRPTPSLRYPRRWAARPSCDSIVERSEWEGDYLPMIGMLAAPRPQEPRSCCRRARNTSCRLLAQLELNFSPRRRTCVLRRSLSPQKIIWPRHRATQPPRATQSDGPRSPSPASLVHRPNQPRRGTWSAKSLLAPRCVPPRAQLENTYLAIEVRVGLLKIYKSKTRNTSEMQKSLYEFLHVETVPETPHASKSL